MIYASEAEQQSVSVIDSTMDEIFNKILAATLDGKLQVRFRQDDITTEQKYILTKLGYKIDYWEGSYTIKWGKFDI